MVGVTITTNVRDRVPLLEAVVSPRALSFKNLFFTKRGSSVTIEFMVPLEVSVYSNLMGKMIDLLINFNTVVKSYWYL